MKLIIRWLIVAVSIFLTAWLIPGIRVEGDNGFITIAIVAIILGFMNAVIRPILTFFSCGCVVLTLGLFMLVINAMTLSLTAWVSQQFGLQFYVDGFFPALFGSIVISIISFVLSILLVDEKER
jgi:putative membrane protein